MSRELFFDAIQKTRGLTDIQRAARFFVAIKESYGSGLDSFGVRPKDMKKAVDFLSQASERLSMVVIDNLDFEHLIRTYDRPGALFYLDPPYYQTEKYYPDRFQPEDHTRLKETLDKVRGKWILSYNDCPEIRNLYDGYIVISAERSHNLVAKNDSKKYREIIIKNFNK